MAWPASLKAWAIRWYFGVFISCIKQHWGYDSLCTARRKQAAEKKNDTPQASEETRQGRPLGVAFGRLICIPRSTSYTSEPEVTRLRIWLGVQTTGERQRVYSWFSACIMKCCRLQRQHPSRTGPRTWRGCDHRFHDSLQQDLADRRMANPMDPVLSHTLPKKATCSSARTTEQ